MRLRWDWLSPRISAPYIPTLGVVGPGCVSADLFEAVLDVADTGRFLPWDKDQRWSDTKDERVLPSEIVHDPDRTLIPSLSLRGRGLIKLYCYGPPPALHQTAEQAAKLAATYRAHGGAKLIWCDDHADDAKSRLMLKELSVDDSRNDNQITELRHCAAADTFNSFAEEADQAGEGGFLFLLQRMRDGHDDGTTLVAVQDGRIAGAVGPLSTMDDAVRVRHQPPQYFTVLPRYRGRGHGRRLWQASMAWGWTNGARYKALQAASGSPAERLYLSEGLRTLGFLHEVTVVSP
ncbi:GNAT family N-acetyltransferase [Spirillospora sp. NPDC048911]|uniref:GNAT family N-acetyltransferase n=1 Tax=Spirillospora sp. NPDC048911 TaxID=3364527 RepID=UPI0037150DD7